MHTYDDTESRLRRAVAVAPSEDGLRWLDQRVADVMARPQATVHGARSTRRMLLRPLALVAAFVVLTGTVVAATGLLDRIFESSGMPGWQTAWDRAERLGVSQTDAGVTITLERAYADLNQVLVGFTVAGLEAPITSTQEPAAIDWIVELRDPTGRVAEQWARSFTGMGMDETGLSAVVQAWEGAVTQAAGTWQLTFTSVGYDGDGFVPGRCTVGATDPECVDPPPSAMVHGSWQFEFELPTPTGTVASADTSDTVGSAMLNVTELRVTPTMITARIGLSLDGIPVRAWSASPAIRHLDATYNVNAATVVYEGDARRGTGETVYTTTAGSDEVAGEWEIAIPELTYQSSDGAQVTLNGPWILTVSAP